MGDGESGGIGRMGLAPVCRGGVYRMAWWVAAFIVALALPAAGQEATAQIRTEIDRLQQSLKDRPVSDPNLPNLDSMIGGSLKAASEALSAGRVYVSLEKLGEASDLLGGGRIVVNKARK